MVGDIDDCGEDFEIGMGRLELGREGFEFIAGAGEKDEGCLFGGEAAGDGGADAHGGACYEDCLVFERHFDVCTQSLGGLDKGRVSELLCISNQTY